MILVDLAMDIKLHPSQENHLKKLNENVKLSCGLQNIKEHNKIFF